MYNQGLTMERTNPAFIGFQDEQKQSEKSSMDPPPYQPNADFKIPRINLNPSGYPNQPYGAPGIPQSPQSPQTPQSPQSPQSPHTQQPFLGMSAYPQGGYVASTGATTQSTMFSTQKTTIIADYLWYSVFTMVCCCCPLGIIASYYSRNTRDANLAGHIEYATRSSKTALILNHVAVGVGIAFFLALTLGMFHYFDYI